MPTSVSSSRRRPPNFKDLKSIHSTRGVAVWKDQLIVSDIGRLMFWNGLDTLSNGRPADGVVGEEHQALDTWDHCCGRIKVDAAGRLWVLSFEGRKFVDVYELPLTEKSVPLHTMWTDISITLPVLGEDSRVAIGPAMFGVAPVGAGEFVWMSDTDNHRVLRIRDPLTNPVVDVILDRRTPPETSATAADSKRRPGPRSQTSRMVTCSASLVP